MVVFSWFCLAGAVALTETPALQPFQAAHTGLLSREDGAAVDEGVARMFLAVWKAGLMVRCCVRFPALV